jgi:hypothetical protein
MELLPLALAVALGVLAGSLGVWLALRARRPAEPRPAPVEVFAVDLPKPLVAVRDAVEESAPVRASAAPHLLALIADAMRDPLQKLRRNAEVPRDALELLERIAWQTRMLVAKPRPMRAAPTSPISLLQEAAEQIPLLRDGSVGASWSLLNRQPVHVDADRMRAAFRCLLLAGAELAGEGGRLGIRILQGGASGFPVQIEIEIGRRGTELDPLSLLVTRHLIEGQGGRIELDGNVTRILLRSAAAEEPVASVA